MINQAPKGFDRALFLLSLDSLKNGSYKNRLFLSKNALRKQKKVRKSGSFIEIQGLQKSREQKVLALFFNSKTT